MSAQTSHRESVAGADAVGAATPPFAPFEWMLALRYLRARRKEGFISVIAGFSFLGIMLGVATLIIVMAVMNGFRKELLDKMLGLNGHVIVYRIAEPFTDFDAVAEKLKTLDGVTHVKPLVEGQALVSGPQQSSGVLARGMREADLKALPAIANNVRFGTLDGFEESGGIAIGTRMAKNLGVGLGDTLSLVSPRGTSTPFGTAPRIKAYPVTAIFEIGMSEYDNSIAFLPLPEAQRYFNRGAAVNVLEVLVENPDQVGFLSAQIIAVAGEDIGVTDWRQRNATFFSALEVERNVMFLILTLIVFVAALNIISGLIMLVKDKGRDIAILRTMGATRGAVMRVFFITGASIGIVGTLAGLLLGVLVCENIESIRAGIAALTNTDLFSPELYFLSRMPADMDPSEVITVVIMALGLSLVATIYPAWRASRLDPVEALRYE